MNNKYRLFTLFNNINFKKMKKSLKITAIIAAVLSLVAIIVAAVKYFPRKQQEMIDKIEGEGQDNDFEEVK